MASKRSIHESGGGDEPPPSGKKPPPPPKKMKQGNLLQFGMRILPDGDFLAADSPAVTPATGLIRQSQQLVLWPATQLQQAKQQRKERQRRQQHQGCLEITARLQGPRLCKPVHHQCSIEGLAGGRQGRSCFEGAVA